ncbi:4395_t:CDS:1, partial [Ambispora gerdemannii]
YFGGLENSDNSHIEIDEIQIQTQLLHPPPVVADVALKHYDRNKLKL